jgi:hypothetical protein
MMTWLIAYVIIGILFSTFWHKEMGLPNLKEIRERETLFNFLSFSLVLMADIAFIAILWPPLLLGVIIGYLKDNYDNISKKYKD